MKFPPLENFFAQEPPTTTIFNMSFRGRGTGANRGGFGSRGGMRFSFRAASSRLCGEANEIFLNSGRGGFSQQSFGPPAQVLGIYHSN
jgi:hypothetical protein